MSIKFCRVTVQERYPVSPQEVAQGIDAYLSREPDIGQEKIDNLRTAALELRHMTILPPKAEKQLQGKTEK